MIENFLLNGYKAFLWLLKLRGGRLFQIQVFISELVVILYEKPLDLTCFSKKLLTMQDFLVHIKIVCIVIVLKIMNKRPLF